MRRVRALLVGFAVLATAPARADGLAPFLPKENAAAQNVRALAPADAIDRDVVEAFERRSGLQVVLDTYARPAEPPDALIGYDLAVLRGPAIAKAIAAGALAKIDRRRLANVRLVQPLVAAKLAAYDREGGYAIALGWSAFGLLYDADKARDRFGGPPTSWTQALGARGRGADCAVVWPDARDESFLAVWKLTGLDPARAKPADVKAAGALLERARGNFLSLAAPDEVGALAKGAACLSAGTEGEAAAARARGGDNGPDVRFAYPREGAPLALYAYVLPRDAQTPERAYRLLDALLAADSAARNAESAGWRNSEATTGLDDLKRLTPEPTFDAQMSAAIRAEWKRLTGAK